MPPPGLNAPARVLVSMAHPDDAEFVCGGTVARWASRGSVIVYVVGTSGDKGSSDAEMTGERLVELRESEQREAAARLGVAEVEFLRFRDAELTASLDLRLAITRMVRRHRPDAVVCQDPTARWMGQSYIQHPDHIAMGEATLAAVFPSARDRLTFPQLLSEGLEPHKVTEIFLAAPKEPDAWVDITDFYDKKLGALLAHASQVNIDEIGPLLRQWAVDSAAEARQAHPLVFPAMQMAEAYKYFRLD